MTQLFCILVPCRHCPVAVVLLLAGNPQHFHSQRTTINCENPLIRAIKNARPEVCNNLLLTLGFGAFRLFMVPFAGRQAGRQEVRREDGRQKTISQEVHSPFSIRCQGLFRFPFYHNRQHAFFAFKLLFVCGTDTTVCCCNNGPATCPRQPHCNCSS